MAYCLTILYVCLFGWTSAYAQSLQVGRPLPGYICMELALTPEQFKDPNVAIPIRPTPSLSVPAVSYASTTVIVQGLQQPTGGFLRVLRLNGQEGWIEARYLRTWRNPDAPSARCTPAIMSDGKPGFSVGR